MTIKTRKPPNSKIERKIIIGMIVSSDFLKEIQPIYSRYKETPFSLPWAAIIADWCIEYYNRYKNAPDKTIQDIFHNHQKTIYDKDQVELIEKFLTGLSEEWEEENDLNIPFLLDETEKHFRLQAVKKINERLKLSISRSDVDEAEHIISDFERVLRPGTIGIDPIGDIDAIEEAFSSENKDILFHLPEDLGAISRFMGPFERGSLTCFMGKEGAGKSWFLQELGLIAVKAGHNVLFVSMEMSQRQSITRIHQNLSSETKQNRIGDILIPVFDCKLNQENNCSKSKRSCNIGILDRYGHKPDWKQEFINREYKISFHPRVSSKYIPCMACRGDYNYQGDTWFIKKKKRGLSTAKAKKKGLTLTKSKLKGKKFKFVRYPVGTKSMKDLIIHIGNLGFYENFRPDLIITDYFSKFLPENKEDKRHQLRHIIEKHKAIAQEYHCAVLTASQTNITRKDDKQGSKAITKGSWQESMAPQAESDRTFAINQSATQKRNGIMLLNMLKERDDEYDQIKDLTILYSHHIGKAILDSEIINNFEEEE